MKSLQYSQASSRREFNGAALVDEQGREIPITEAMILRACRELEQAWHYPAPARKAG